MIGLIAMTKENNLFTIKELLLKWLSGEIDEEELVNLMELTESSEDLMKLMADLKDDEWLAKELDKLKKVNRKDSWEKILKVMNTN